MRTSFTSLKRWRHENFTNDTDILAYIHKACFWICYTKAQWFRVKRSTLTFSFLSVCESPAKWSNSLRSYISWGRFGLTKLWQQFSLWRYTIRTYIGTFGGASNERLYSDRGVEGEQNRKASFSIWTFWTADNSGSRGFEGARFEARRFVVYPFGPPPPRFRVTVGITF